MLYIISQILVCLAYVFAGITMIIKDRTKILIFNFTATVCFCLSYLCLFAWAGVAMNAVSILRNIVFFLITKYTANSKNQKWWEIGGLVLIQIIIVVCAIFTYKGFLSLMPIFAAALYTYCIWQKNNLVFKIISMTNSAMWIAYNVYVNSIMGIILESIMIICGIVGLIKLSISAKKEKENKENEEKEVVENGTSETGESC